MKGSAANGRKETAGDARDHEAMMRRMDMMEMMMQMMMDRQAGTVPPTK
jgi:hypothetical protein